MGFTRIDKKNTNNNRPFSQNKSFFSIAKGIVQPTIVSFSLKEKQTMLKEKKIRKWKLIVHYAASNNLCGFADTESYTVLYYDRN